MSKELIERLRSEWRKPENKPSEMCEAADRIEQLEAENAELDKIARDCTSGYEAALIELAASQAREQQLREFSLDQWWYKELQQIAEESGVVHLSLDAKRAIIGVVSNLLEKIESGSDTTALEAMIQKAGEVMRERCATLIDYDCSLKGGKVIRALPNVTLED